MKDTLFILVERLLKNNKIPFDKEELSFQIQSHPSYPSLHAITGVLDHFNIENVAADVPVNIDTLNQLPNCFLAQVNIEKGNDLVIVEKNEKTNNFTLFHSNQNKEKVTTNKFLEQFTGIIVAVEKNENSVSTNTNSSFTSKALTAITLLSVGFFIINKSTNISSILFLLLSFVGTIMSLAILRQEQGYTTAIGEAFCSGETEKKDCNAVLTSDGAKIFKDIKLSDLSLIFFTTLTIFSAFLHPNLEILKIISILSFPVTLYSIYYQYTVVKKWCLLCLSIVGVLWAQLTISLYNLPINFELITYNETIIFTAILSFVYLAWHYLKPIFSELNTLKKEKIEFIKFKRNFALFDSLLKKSATIDTKLNSDSEIVFGNKNSSLEIVIITNPFCGHCKPVHKLVEDILNRYKNNVKIIIRFNISINDEKSNGVIVTSRLIEIYNTLGKEECIKAMNVIYGGEDTSKWSSIFGETENIKTYLEVLNTEKEWCTNNGINFTPEILINGKAYPKEYKREDLIFFIEELEENCYVNTTSNTIDI